MAIQQRLRAVWSALWGSGGGILPYAPWHLGRDERVPVQVNERTALTLTAVYRAVSLLSDAASSAPILLYSRPQSGGRVVDSSSAAARALATLTHADMELAAWGCALGGNGFLRIYRDGNNAPSELRAVPPYLISMEIEQGTLAIWYRILADPLTGEPEAYVPEADMIHCKYRVTGNRLWGVPPMSSCGPAFEAALQSRAVQKYLFQNLATPGSVLLAPGKIEPAVARKLQSEFDENYRGGGSGRTAVLSNGLDVKSIVWKAGDQQLLEQISASINDIARSYSIPAYHLEQLQTATYASASEATRALYALALRAFTTRIADAMAQKLITRNDRAAGAGIEFDLSDTLIMPGKEMSDFLGGLVNAGIATPNEVRNQYLHLPDAPGGDTLRVPTGSLHADQATPQAARAWERGRKYGVGTFICHDSGLWMRSAHGPDEEPGADSASWDCIAPGIKEIQMVDGRLEIEMSGGHCKTLEVQR